MKIEPTHDRGVFTAESESDIGKSFRVDLVANGGRGQCDCQHWQFRCSPMVTAGMVGPKTRCKHIEAARSKLAEMMGFEAESLQGKEAVLLCLKKWVDMEKG